MRIVFMGTPEFALPSLKILLEHEYPIAAVVTGPDKPAGRGLQVSSSPVKAFAQERKLGILQPEKLKEDSFIASLRSLEPDLFVVVAFRILPAEVFRIAKLGAFNLHASLLPKYRGAAPINWAIIKGERETGVTTFFLQETVDTGTILLQARVPIGENETAGELHDRLAGVGAEIVLHSVRLIESGKAVPKPQDDSLATPAPKILKEHTKIDWSKGAVEVHDLVRGLSPRPCAFAYHNRTLLKIYRTTLAGDAGAGAPGEILDAADRLRVSTGDGVIEILEIQQEGKRKMTAAEFLRGYRLSAGDKLR
ncbi:MAG: methionyl-tRNA formyltransferase [Ignavibacteria bacterium]|nr:MAG: methionyl-tRNA formyltransferase [Ignavibacteria bacterium]